MRMRPLQNGNRVNSLGQCVQSGKSIHAEEFPEEFDLKSYVAMLKARPAFAKTSAHAAAGIPAFIAYMQAAM